MNRRSTAQALAWMKPRMSRPGKMSAACQTAGQPATAPGATPHTGASCRWQKARSRRRNSSCSTMMVATMARKMRMLRAPTQVFTTGQWWSISITHLKCALNALACQRVALHTATSTRGCQEARLLHTLQCLERSGRSTRHVMHGPRHKRCCPSPCRAPSRAHHAGGCSSAFGMNPGSRVAALGRCHRRSGRRLPSGSNPALHRPNHAPVVQAEAQRHKQAQQ